MTPPNNKISEIELQAYIDNELDSVRHAEVEEIIQNNPDLQQQVTEYQQINDGLKSLFQPNLDEVMPEQLIATVKPEKSSFNYSLAAMVLISIFAGTILGWFSRGELLTDTLPITPNHTQLVRDAFSFHAVYTPEVKHPVEVTSDHHDHLVKWLSKRLETQVTAPDFSSSGFELLGGRLLSSSNTPAAQFMYENNAGKRLTIFTRQKSPDEPDITEFQYASKNGMNGFYWTDKNLSFVILSDISKNKIYELVSKVCNN